MSELQFLQYQSLFVVDSSSNCSRLRPEHFKCIQLLQGLRHILALFLKGRLQNEQKFYISKIYHLYYSIL